MICPNCGKNIDQNVDVCPYCKKPTQFSSRMKYYPRNTPLNSAPTQPPHQAVNDTREMKAILSGMGDLPKKRDLRSAKNIILLTAGTVGIICLVVSLVCTFLLSNRIDRNNQFVQNSLYSLEGKLSDMSSSYEDLKTTIDDVIVSSSDQMESGSEAIVEGEVLVIMYCQYPDEANSPLCLFVKKGASFRLPNLSFAGYQFLGWERDYIESGIVIPSGESFTVNEDGTIELYATWQAIETPSPEPIPTPTPDTTVDPFSQEQPETYDFPHGGLPGNMSDATPTPSDNLGDENKHN